MIKRIVVDNRPFYIVYEDEEGNLWLSTNMTMRPGCPIAEKQVLEPVA